MYALAGLAPHININTSVSRGEGEGGGTRCPRARRAQRPAAPLQISLLQAHPQLKQCVRQSVERAVQELVHPVVDRSIKIAMTTCEQIIRKDFALDSEESRMRLAAHHMMRNLTAGMAMITCREPLLMSIATNLKNSFAAALRVSRDLPLPLAAPDPGLGPELGSLSSADPDPPAEGDDGGGCSQDLSGQLRAGLLLHPENGGGEGWARDGQETGHGKKPPASTCQRAWPVWHLFFLPTKEFELRKHARQEGRRYCDPVVLTYQAERMPEQIRLKVSPPPPPLCR